VSKYETIRLPMRQEDGSMVHRTLEGEWLVGCETPGDSGLPLLSYPGDNRDVWGWGYWFVIRSAAGKLVVYKTALRENKDAILAVFDSFEEMQPHVPPNIYEEALLRAGLKKPPQFPEIPLEGV
jgi:hypothetical protein